jgi:hypothetical protein
MPQNALPDRNLRREAQAFAHSHQLVRVRENRKIPRHSRIGAWDVHVKNAGDRMGKCVVTLVSFPGEKFEVALIVEAARK